MKRKGGNACFAGEYMASRGYFAGANGEEGFVSYFGQALSDIERVYVLKGGCGCGKSALMKRVAAEAQRRGEDAERIYCASDPASLDGVVLKDRGIAIVDGTAPHEISPRLPGAADSIVNLGDYWNAGVLRQRVEEIRRLSGEKESWRKRAEGLLRAAGVLRSEGDRLTEGALLKSKLCAAAERTVRRIAPTGKGGEQTRLRRAFCADGYTIAADYGERRTVPVRDPHGIAHVFLAALSTAARSRRLSLTLSPDPLCPRKLDGVLIEDTGTLYTVDSRCEGERPINTERFIDRAALAPLRHRLRFISRIVRELEAEAADALAESRRCHMRLESIYTPTMDFSAVDKRAEAMIKEIFA